MAKCYIFGAVEGTVSDFKPQKSDLVIAADAGYLTLKKMGIKPNIVIGDFDSLGEEPENENTVRHPEIKDDTDTMLSIKAGLKKGFKDFVIYGCLGGRLDQTIASIQSASFILKNGGKCVLCEHNFCVTVIENESLCFKENSVGLISVFALNGVAKGVNLSGLKYPLINATVTPDFPIGVSNEFTGEKATVSVDEGILTVMWRGSIENISEVL